MPTVKRYFCLHVLLSRYVFAYTLFFYNNVVFQAQAESSYFSADFRLKIFLYYSYIIAYDILQVFGIWIRIALHCACAPPSARPICHVKQQLAVLALKNVFRPPGGGGGTPI